MSRSRSPSHYFFFSGFLRRPPARSGNRGEKGGLSAAETGRESHRLKQGLGKTPACDHVPGSEEQELLRGQDVEPDEEGQAPVGA